MPRWQGGEGAFLYEGFKANVLFLSGEYTAAADMYYEGAREGDEAAAFNYAYCLLRGLGRAYDPTLAKSFFSYARDYGEGESCYNLAMLYMHGEGVKRDLRRSLEYMQASASLGCIEAQLYLGMAYTTGCMLEPDISLICMIPYHKAEYRAEDIMLLGSGIPTESEEDFDYRYAVLRADSRRAFEWFKTAAAHDPTYVGELVAKGKYLYAKCYVDGLGTDFDFYKGAELMLLAEAGGSREAAAFLAERGLTRERLLAAKTKKRK